MELPLLQKTEELLDECDLSLMEISNMTGLGYEWLKKIKAKSIPDPGVHRVEKLYNFLAARLLAAEATKKNPVIKTSDKATAA
jgi:hypothetical protein